MKLIKYQYSIATSY